MEHGETSTVFVVARSAKRNNHDPHDLLVGFRRVDDIFSLRRNVGERNWNDLEDIVGCVSKGRERNFNIFRLWRKHKHFARYREAKM